MFSLILKDILIQKRMHYFALGYAVFILIAFQNPVMYSMSYVMGAMAISYFFILGACAYDNKSEIAINSLPIERKEIVRAKYLSVLVLTAMSIAVLGILGGLMKGAGLPVPREYISAGDVLGTIISVVLLTSLYLPIFFKYGYVKSRVFNIIMFLVFFFAPNLLVEYVKANYDQEVVARTLLAIFSQPSWVLGLGTVVLLLLLLFISSLVSIRIYNNREF